MSLSRRQVMAAGAAMLRAAPLESQDQPAKVGVIGLGLRATGAHIPALKRIAGSAKITALCDIQPDRMAKVNDGLRSKAATYVDYREMVKDPNVSIVVIATPGYLHHDMALAALRAGKDLLIEKPLALNYRDAMEIVKEAERSGRTVAVGMQRRYGDGDAEFQAAIDSGLIGPVRVLIASEYRGDWNAQSWTYTDPATGQKNNWRNLAKTAGSTELEFSIHALAQITNMVKSPLERVSASGGTVHYRDGRTTRDVTTILAEFSSGARLDYSFALFAPGISGNLTVVGDKGSLRRDYGNSGTLMGTIGGKTAPVKLNLNLGEGSMEVRMWREFLQSIHDHKPSVISPRVALEPAKIAYAADISIREHRFVTAKDFA